MSDAHTTENGKNAKLPHLTLTVRQFADRMQISMPTAYAMTEWEGFPVLHVGKKKLIPLAALECWLDEQVCGDATQRKVAEQWQKI